jgi:hypothetical protein
MPFRGAKGYSHLTTARVTRETSKLRESAVHDAPIREVAGASRPSWCSKMEIGTGVSMAGRRALVCTKSVGMNTMLDPLMVLNLTPVHGGLGGCQVARHPTFGEGCQTPAVAAGSPWGVTPPGLPQIRACAINAHGSSSHAYATLATLGRHVDTAPGLEGPAVFPSQAA